jgi:hypothetical protein
MSYLRGSFLAQHYRNNIEAAGPVLYFTGCEEITGSYFEFIFFIESDNRFDGFEIFAGPGFYLDENDGAIGIDHDEVDFAGFTGEVAGEFFEAFCFEIFFAAFFAPSAEEFAVGQ